MLKNPVHDGLKSLRLHSMARAYEEQDAIPDIGEYTFDDRLGMMLDREIVARSNRRLAHRIKHAGFKHSSACMENIDYRSDRGLDRSLLMSLSSCRWVYEKQGVLITGATGTGKTWLSCALGHKACMEGYTVLYRRMAPLLREMEAARETGEMNRMMEKLIKPDLLILDDWGMEKLNSRQSLHMLEIAEERYGAGSLLMSSQLPVNRWHETLHDPTIADAILDRIVHSSRRIELGTGSNAESMRKLHTGITETDNKETMRGKGN
jgi:DNA replication protein DnaC